MHARSEYYRWLNRDILPSSPAIKFGQRPFLFPILSVIFLSSACSIKDSEQLDCNLLRTPPSFESKNYEPPINIFISVHVDNPSDMNMVETESYYLTIRHNILQILNLIEEYCGVSAVLFNGWFPQMLMKLDDVEFLQEVIDRGHEVGTHAHSVYYDEETGKWMNDKMVDLKRYGSEGKYDSISAFRCWKDATRFMNEALSLIPSPPPNNIMTAVPFIPSDEWRFMETLDFEIAPGNRSDKFYRKFGHIVWNPFRPSNSNSPDDILREDPSAPYIFIDHYPQIGTIDHNDIDVTLPKLKTAFILLYIEWLHREMTGEADKIWTFGFAMHPNWELHMSETEHFLKWLNKNFVGKKTPRGNFIAVYSRIGEIYNRFLSWEESNPNSSSFSYTNFDDYPYSFPVLADLLGKGRGEFVDLVRLEEETVAFRFDVENTETYILMREVADSGPVEVDLSTLLSPPFIVLNMDETLIYNFKDTVEIGSEPLVILKERDILNRQNAH